MFRIEVDAKIENGPVITEAVDEQLESFGCLPKAQIQIDVAIDEIFSNIAYYAYEDGEGKVTVTVNHLMEQNQAAIEFSDSGVPFNPLETKAPDTTLSAEDRKIGGLGIFLVKKTMDDVTYRYEDGKNILTLYKTIC